MSEKHNDKEIKFRGDQQETLTAIDVAARTHDSHPFSILSLSPSLIFPPSLCAGVSPRPSIKQKGSGKQLGQYCRDGVSNIPLDL